MSQEAPCLVVVGASAGGIRPLVALAGALPADIPAAIAVALHVPPDGTSRLPEILARAGKLPASHAEDGEPLLAGRIYVAPPDCHLLVRDGRLAVERGPREHLTRPAIDPLFRTAAASFGARTIAVVLSGTREDGAEGAAAVARAGGTVVVQDPGEAEFPGMPLTTIARENPDYVLPLAEIVPTLLDLATRNRTLSAHAEMSDDRGDEMSLDTSYAALAHQSEAIDRALWAALDALEERETMTERIAARIRGQGSEATARRFDRLAQAARHHAKVIRDVLVERDGSDGS